jgi:hypothetical protein
VGQLYDEMRRAGSTVLYESQKKAMKAEATVQTVHKTVSIAEVDIPAQA